MITASERRCESQRRGWGDLIMWYKIHTNDLPKWALRERKQPHSYLDFLGEPALDLGDGKGLISSEEAFLRRQYEAAVSSNRKAIEWLLKRVIAERAEQLKAADKRATVAIRGIPRLSPLAPVLVALGCISVDEPQGASKEPAQIRFATWFEDALKARIPEDKLALAKEWIAQGGYQKPGNPDRDRGD